MMSLGERWLFLVNCVFSICSDGCNFMDNAFCVEKGGGRVGGEGTRLGRTVYTGRDALQNWK